MRIGFDAGPLLDPPTGVGRYTRELSEALSAQGIEMVPYAVALRGGHEGPIGRWRVPARLARWMWKRFDRPSITRLTGEVDAIHGTNFVLPALGGKPGVVTVHDLSFLRSDTFPGGPRLRDLVPWSIRRAARVLAPTRGIADEISSEYGVESERVTVTYEGVAPRFFGATPLADTLLGRMGIPGPFVVAVGTIEPRKNLGRLLQAWSSLRSELAGWTLVLAGPKGWGRELPQTDGVVLTGWVGDETLPGLLAAAQIFCYPSLYEGFGLPPLEAMAAGTPAIVGRYSVAEEVLGEAAVLVDPVDPDAIAGALLRLARDEGARMGLQIAGRARAVEFTWERTAQATAAAYRDVIDR